MKFQPEYCFHLPVLFPTGSTRELAGKRRKKRRFWRDQSGSGDRNHRPGKMNRDKRLKFARDMLKKPIGFWETVIWSEESQFNLFGSDGKVMVWRTPKEEYDPHCIVPTVKHDGGSVTVWSCFARNMVGKMCILDRNMDRFYYRDILEKLFIIINQEIQSWT